MDNELIELLEFAKSQKLDFVEYEGKKYNVKKYKFKKYYTIYDKNDFYLTEYDSFNKLQNFLNVPTENSLSAMLKQGNTIQDKYNIHTIYEIVI